MITKEGARNIVAAHLKAVHETSNYRAIVLDEHTKEFDFGWVFFYDSDKHLETGAIEDMLAGNAPIIVTRTGDVHVTGTAQSIEYYIERFRKYGTPYPKGL
jgi:hypothetical protein